MLNQKKVGLLGSRPMLTARLRAPNKPTSASSSSLLKKGGLTSVPTLIVMAITVFVGMSLIIHASLNSMDPNGTFSYSSFTSNRNAEGAIVHVDAEDVTVIINPKSQDNNAQSEQKADESIVNGESVVSPVTSAKSASSQRTFENHNGIFGNSVDYSNYNLNYWIELNLKQNEWDESEEVFNKRMQIRDTFIRAWTDYDNKCHGQDELRPLSGRCNNWVGMGLTAIDALDTMYLMGLKQQWQSIMQWVKSELNVTPSKRVSFFETTIRCLGGLVSAFDVSGESRLLELAVELGKSLGRAFNRDSGMPMSEINLKSGARSAAGWTGGSVLLAEVGTVQLEFQSATDRSGGKQGPMGDLGELASSVFAKLDPLRNSDIKLPMRGQYPIYIDPRRGVPKGSQITWGAMGDSFYEYLLKFYIYQGKQDENLRRMYIESSEGMLENLYQKCDECGTQGLWYIRESNHGSKHAKMDELACFTGGMLALGVMHDVLDGEEMTRRHREAAENLGETCYHMFVDQKSGLSGEYVKFGGRGMTVGGGGTDFYILRPETVETMFYLYRMTGDKKWREKGWQIYENIERNCRVPEGQGFGYSPLLDVNGRPRLDPRGVMHSFFLAETLKYLYLLFSTPHLVPLDVFVFNTEAHPLRIPSTMQGSQS